MGTIRGWRRWMDGIVEQLADQKIRHRWLRLRSECSDWIEDNTTGSRFIGTGERSILDQFTDGTPFYDRDALAF